MKISEEELKQSAVESGLSTDQAQALWRQLQARSEVEAHFGPAHVGYYFGALLVIGAMGWFMTNGWDSFAGWQVSAIATSYALFSSLRDGRSGRKDFFEFQPACSRRLAYA